MSNKKFQSLADKFGLDITFVTKWEPPESNDLRPLIAMPNLPKPCHNQCPRTLLGASTWNHMRKKCYADANYTCEVCGERVDEDIDKRHLHAHEVFSIDYARGKAKFVRCVALCSTAHLACIHTGRAYTLWKNNNPLYPKEFLLEGAEKAFTIISSYNRDHPEAGIRAYATFMEYLKHDELRERMLSLIKKYKIKFYREDESRQARWEKWAVQIGSKEYPTPYENEKAWKEAMEKRGEKDTARLLQKNMEERFSGGVYDELNALLNESVGNLSKKGIDSISTL